MPYFICAVRLGVCLLANMLAGHALVKILSNCAWTTFSTLFILSFEQQTQHCSHAVCASGKIRTLKRVAVTLDSLQQAVQSTSMLCLLVSAPSICQCASGRVFSAKMVQGWLVTYAGSQ